MYQYFHDPLSFRLSTWPWGGASYIKTFNYRVHNILFKPLLDYLAAELDKSPTLKVRKTTFTLVNVYSGFTDMSYGSGPAPYRSIRRGPIVFTFAMTRREGGFQFPRHVIWNTGHTALWGPNLQRGHDYLSISVPINIAMQCRLNNTLRTQMEWLYKIVGGWSKSYAMSRDSFTLRSDSNKLTHDQLYFRTIPKTMWMFPWQDWKYVREFWDRGADVLNLDNLDVQFVDYFLSYLTRYFNKVDDPNVKPAFEFIEQTVRSGILDCVQRTSSDLSRLVEPYIPIDIKTQMVQGEATDVESLVRAICNGDTK
ncbi:hypothetical protein O152_gp292 [Pseudomonas phage PaBG]|uniref:Uncharacterized protein n=1 Tax=Pseudomonas phage PaBG TaxID=1335230 RepID=S5VZN3_9CAUD|nr:hypothetical protein O152_gp292 [Pseudomonas phage PaBG]AGS82070.1 hypothetical protein PaBG_00194 [Pseudomonas phage PaBG]